MIFFFFRIKPLLEIGAILSVLLITEILFIIGILYVFVNCLIKAVQMHGCYSGMVITEGLATYTSRTLDSCL